MYGVMPDGEQDSWAPLAQNLQKTFEANFTGYSDVAHLDKDTF